MVKVHNNFKTRYVYFIKVELSMSFEFGLKKIA